jgi:hypothetical protein
MLDGLFLFSFDFPWLVALGLLLHKKEAIGPLLPG